MTTTRGLAQKYFMCERDSYLKPSGHTMSSVPILGAVPMDEEEEERQAKKVLKQQEEKARAEEKERRAKKEKEAAKNQEEQKKKSTGLPKLYDRHGKEVDLSRLRLTCFFLNHFQAWLLLRWGRQLL